MVDECGLPVKLMLSPGQTSDKVAAMVIVEELAATSIVVGGREQQRSVAPEICRQRNLVERFNECR